MYVFCRENAKGSKGGNPAVRKRFKRGTFSLSEPAYRTSATGGEIRRFEGGDNSGSGEHSLYFRVTKMYFTNLFLLLLRFWYHGNIFMTVETFYTDSKISELKSIMTYKHRFWRTNTLL